MALLGSGLFSLAVFATQQLGIVLGVGAETVLLVVYLLALERHQAEHAHLPPLARMLQRWGLGIVIVSGLGAVALHMWLGQENILLAPAFIFKWILLAVLCGWYWVESYAVRLPLFAAAVVRGVGGAQWYALLVVHLLAPVVTWPYLLLLYAAWVVVFVAGWSGFAYVMLPKRLKLSEQEEALASPAIELPRPKVPLLVAYHPLLAAPATTHAPAPAPLPPSGLPHITVMPQSPQQLQP
jgi:hypothetical protein